MRDAVGIRTGLTIAAIIPTMLFLRNTGNVDMERGFHHSRLPSV